MDNIPAEYPTTISTILPETMDMYRKNRGLTTYDEQRPRIVQEERKIKTIEWCKTPAGIVWLTLLIVIIAALFLHSTK